MKDKFLAHKLPWENNIFLDGTLLSHAWCDNHISHQPRDLTVTPEKKVNPIVLYKYHVTPNTHKNRSTKQALVYNLISC